MSSDGCLITMFFYLILYHAISSFFRTANELFRYDANTRVYKKLPTPSETTVNFHQVPEIIPVIRNLNMFLFFLLLASFTVAQSSLHLSAEELLQEEPQFFVGPQSAFTKESRYVPLR